MGYMIKRYINDCPVSLDELLKHTITDTTITSTVAEVVAKNNRRYHEIER